MIDRPAGAHPLHVEWLPFLENDIGVGADTVLLGHSSGAEAAMRFAEDHAVAGLVLVAACHSDLG